MPENGSDGFEKDGLEFDVARTLDEVIDCWRVTYAAYLRQGLIEPNPFGLHTTPEALAANVAFALGRKNGTVVTTATAMIDGPAGLPLDSVFPDELDTLRREHRRLMEIGLMASVLPIQPFGTLRLAAHFGLHRDCTDFLCGMHPRRAKLYRRLFGMSPLGSVRMYPLATEQPVCLMRGIYEVALHSSGLFRRVGPFMQTPVPAHVFTDCYRLEAGTLKHPSIAGFVQHIQRTNPGRQPVT